MGVQPMLGRLFTEAHETPGNDAVVVLSHGLWQRRFGGARDVLGQTITLNGRPHEIIGVMPATLQVPAEAELWKPLAPAEDAREARGVVLAAGDRPAEAGVSVEQAQTEMSGIAARLEQAYPEQSRLRRLRRVAAPAARRRHRALADRAARGGRLRAADRLRQPRQPDARADRGAPQGAGDPHGARRRPRAADPPDRHRGARARVGRQRAGPAARVLGDRLLHRARRRQHPAARSHRASTGACCCSRWSSRSSRRCSRASSRRCRPRAPRSSTACAKAAARADGRPAAARAACWSPPKSRWRSCCSRAPACCCARCGRMQHVDRGFSPERVATMRLSLPAALYAGPPEVRGFYARLLERVRALPGVESAATGTGVLHAAARQFGRLHASKASRCRRRTNRSNIPSRSCRPATSRRSA